MFEFRFGLRATKFVQNVCTTNRKNNYTSKKLHSHEHNEAL